MIVLNIKKGLFVGLLALGMMGCSEPEPQVIDMDELAAEAGLSKDDYIVHENGAMEIKSKVDDVALVAKTPVINGSPLVTHGDNWRYVIANALMIADSYAVENNPAATFIGNDVKTDLIEQIGGKYNGDYLLTVLNGKGDSINYAQLRPLFDINKSSDDLEKQLDEEVPLWEVTIAKHNGKEF